MFNCALCSKPVKDKGSGFRFFVEFEQKCYFSLKSKKPLIGLATHQIRICSKCLKKDYQIIKI
jgi:hypothetical protein